jgi:hypothetical protein
MTSYSALTGKF